MDRTAACGVADVGSSPTGITIAYFSKNTLEGVFTFYVVLL